MLAFNRNIFASVMKDSLATIAKLKSTCALNVLFSIHLRLHVHRLRRIFVRSGR